VEGVKDRVEGSQNLPPNVATDCRRPILAAAGGCTLAALPTGTVTLLFTDIEGSTRLLQQIGDRYSEVLTGYWQLLRTAVQEQGGQEVDTQGDAFFFAFPRARDALMVAVSVQRTIATHQWPKGGVVRVRMGLHTGEPLIAGSGYKGMDVHRAARIGAAGHGGQILLSEATHGLIAKDLPAGIGLRDLGEHRLKDLAGPHRLFQVVANDLPADFPPLKSLDVLPNNLPLQLTSFIGREREKSEIKKLLSTTRLLTLTGSGGAGKTRLALQVAAEALEEFPAGVWLVELAALSDPSLVPKAVASALGVTEQPGRSLTETLADSLPGKWVLVILDNCEHLVAACAQLANVLLRACPNLRMLATSRESLGVTGETTWRVPSLSVPDPQRLPPLYRFTEYDAVRLFIDRAVASAPQFAVTRSNAPAVAQVCHRLDGIPLALELAAARVKVLAVEQIAARLDDRFRLLTGGSRTALPRQQTLRAAMNWSHDLLSQKERAVLRRLSVFAGGCTLEAAEAVCAWKRVKDHEILDLLMQLVDKSLVSAETLSGEVRYRMPETIRQYGQDRLMASGEAAEVRTRHRAWYLSLAERADARMGGPEETMWLDRLEVEHDNLRAALGWSTSEEGDAETRLRLAAALVDFWTAHTHWGEGRRWLETALAESRDTMSTARVRALRGEGALVWRQGDDGRAMALFEESHVLARELGDQTGIADALIGLGLVTMRRGDSDAATALFEEGLELSRKLENKWFMAGALAQMGAVTRYKGDYAKAVALCEESLAIFRTLGGQRWIAYALRLTGHAVRLQGDLEQAAGLYRESLALFGETGDKWVATECIEGLALIASAQGKHERAARLFGAAEAARETFGITMPRPEAGDQEHFWAAIRERTEGTTFAAAWAEGRAMTLEQAIDYALSAAGDGTL
jgi:predicted ATPase/class 3 adenylate cyclase